MISPRALELIADELEKLNGIGESVKDHMAQANAGQAEANRLLIHIIGKLEHLQENNADSQARIFDLERKINVPS